MTENTQKFPKYYALNFETFIKVDLKDGIVTAENQWGNPFPPAEALEGNPTTEKQFDRAVLETGRII